MRIVGAALLTAAGVVAAAGPSVAAPPPVGACFSYSAEQWVQTEFTAPLVDCAAAHNGEVLGLVTIPADLTEYGSLDMKGWAYQQCQAVATAYVWKGKAGRYPKSTYVLPRSARLNIQIPTGQQWVDGERWAACLGQSRNQKLSAAQNRIGSVRGQGLKPYVCYSTRNWKGSKCSKPDAVRMTNQVWLPKGNSGEWVGSDKVLRQTQQACNKLRKKKDLLRTWFTPGYQAWSRGNMYGFCQIAK